ncbi:MFS transporter [Pseudomonas vanderleydeniana]|uniref:MFS transporter n=1 Tax=Pseudomonas vanderleydeniana TaxID=2745495 RepID=A0A9E6PHP2_9PSED|nr:MFS transporter [Pseudomonas vanderleydeniana]QXI26296.1 MFS transporter [Pseudomonas vanderleydeniana]
MQEKTLNSVKDSRSAVSPWVMVAVGAGSILSSLDLFVVNLAFSTIRDSFGGASNLAMAWVLSAYSISFAAFLVPCGTLADIYGRKRIFKAGIAAFAIASLACAVAPDILSLIIARGCKGIAAAMIIPTSLGLLLASYPKESHKKMVGIWAATGSVAAALGPTLGGALVDINWRLIFIINIPIAFIALWFSRYLVESAKKKSALPDIIGTLFLIIGIACLVAGISYAPTWGFKSPSFLLTLCVTTLSLGIFVRRCFNVDSPALDLSVFRSPNFTVATIGMACFYMGFAIMLLGTTLFMTQIWKFNPMIAGAAVGVGPGTAVIASLLTGKIKLSATYFTFISGFLFLGAGIWWLYTLGDNSEYVTSLLPGLILTGIAAGIGQTGFIVGGTAELKPQNYAAGTGIINTSRQIGAAMGVAVFVSVSGTAVSAGQYTTAWLLMALFGLLASLSALSLKAKS